MAEFFFESSTIRNLGGDGNSEHGVHVSYEYVFNAMAYIAFIYALGFLGQRFLLMPALVGQIVAGIIFGPQLLNEVPLPEAFVLLGEIGLVLLVVEAGVDINVTTLKLIGARGVIIAIIGSILPIAIGLGVALVLGADFKAAIAAGSSFGPTSLGIAMNILREGKIINTPTGQLIVAAAIIDDMIALIILSILKSLSGELTVGSVLQPIGAALAFLIIGGYLALFIVPGLIDKFILKEGMDDKRHGKIALIMMWALVIGMMPATKYSGASHLMGCFLAGLVFCADHHLHVEFVDQFKRLLQWLMRIFFASTIGFQVPVKNFGSGKVLLHGLFFTTALVGKLAVGFIVPNFYKTKRFRGFHLRDCLMVGCSMAAEGEFAFVIAAHSVDQGIMDSDLYSSVVLAILLSTIIAPFSLRYTINFFNRVSIEEVGKVEEEMKDYAGYALKNGIKDGSFAFFCINTTSHASWGTLPTLMKILLKHNLEVIDHRSWHTRFEDTVINECFVKGTLGDGIDSITLIAKIEKSIIDEFNQPDALVTVTRWLPGVINDIECGESLKPSQISDSLINEAQRMLNTHETKDKLLGQHISSTINESESFKSERRLSAVTYSSNRRVKVTSNPASKVMFKEPEPTEVFQPKGPVGRSKRLKTKSTPLSVDMWRDTPVALANCEFLVTVSLPGGEKLKAQINESTIDSMRAASAPLNLEESKNALLQDDHLHGFIRRAGRTRSISRLSFESGRAEEMFNDQV